MTVRRRGRLLTGLALAVVAVGLIFAGASAAVAGSAGTYVDLGAHGTYRTDRFGLATRGTNWRTQLLGWAGSVRLKVAPAGGKQIFVGVGPEDAVSRYLAGSGYTTIADGGGGVVRADHEGTAPPPVRTVAWTAAAEGAGTQTLRWHATGRPQIVFARNADGSRAVRVRVVSSAVTLGRMPWWAPAGALVLGVVLLPPAGLLLRRRQPRG